ncbi:MAG TPA: UDP-N-acetylmuramoyl-L-alanine--D-glutamate ligase [Acidimicrobiia bacterium]|nr:UDP-N-acetylmuramoyl-L-alanine--D-glutamate ligase [Acidimicrobiia bacterium]
MRLLVLGAGVSGLAASTLARRQGHSVTIYDDGRPEAAPLLEIGVGLVSGGWDAGLLDGIDLVVASPGFPERSLPVVETLESGVPVWSEVEFAWRAIAGRPVVAVTGTNGKTTVTTLTTEILRASGIGAVAAGNIGTPLSAVVDDAWDVAVIEVSSFQLRFIDRFHPGAAAILNIAEDHLDWHGSVQAYAAAKARIFERQDADDLLVYDADDPGAASAAGRAVSELHPVSGSRRPEGGSGVEGGSLHLPGTSIPLSDLGSSDPAHLVDMAISAVLSSSQGAEPDALERVLKGFRPGAHRRSLVSTVDGVAYVDDSKATNTHAALAAIAAYPSVVLIAGGLAKGLDLTPLAAAANVVALIGIGSVGPELAAAAGERGHVAATMDEAVALAASLARPGDTVLLAPGGASFDQFQSYAERGEIFVSAVGRLEKEHSS